jgi:cobalamin biosynthesis protein CobD/CbiB
MAGSKPDLEKAKESLKKYVNRQRKTMPSKNI